MWRLTLVLGLAATLAGFAAGWRVHDWRDASAELRQTHATVAIVQRQAVVSQQVAVTAQAAQDRIRTVTRTLIEKVPVYVPPDVDRSFALPVGFVRLHDAAVRGDDLSAPAQGPAEPDDAASDVAASAAAAVIVTNYGACRTDQQRLADLQAWARGEGLAN